MPNYINISNISEGQPVESADVRTAFTELDALLYGIITGTQPIISPPSNYFRVGAVDPLTIDAAGAIAITSSAHILSANSGVTDNLDTISAPSQTQVLFLRAATGHTITLRHAVGNIYSTMSANFTLSDSRMLMLTGSDGKWYAQAGSEDPFIDVALTGRVTTLEGQMTTALSDITNLRAGFNFAYGQVTGGLSTTSTSFVDMSSSLNLTFTPRKATSPILIGVYGTYSHNTTSADRKFDIAIDGTRIGHATYGTQLLQPTTQPDRRTGLMLYVTTLSVASHTIKPQWATSSGTLSLDSLGRGLSFALEMGNG